MRQNVELSGNGLNGCVTSSSVFKSQPVGPRKTAFNGVLIVHSCALGAASFLGEGKLRIFD